MEGGRDEKRLKEIVEGVADARLHVNHINCFVSLIFLLLFSVSRWRWKAQGPVRAVRRMEEAVRRAEVDTKLMEWLMAPH